MFFIQNPVHVLNIKITLDGKDFMSIIIHMQNATKWKARRHACVRRNHRKERLEVVREV